MPDRKGSPAYTRRIGPVRFSHHERHGIRQRAVRVGPLLAYEMLVTGAGYTLCIRTLSAGPWDIARGPADGLIAGLGERSRYRWLRSAHPAIMLSYTPEDDVDA